MSDPATTITTAGQVRSREMPGRAFCLADASPAQPGTEDQ